MAPVNDQSGKQAVVPWFTDRSVNVVTFRINRRPRPQGSLFDSQPDSFIDHLAEVLLFGQAVRVGRRGNRHWQLGNRHIDSDGRFIAGILGWETEEPHEQDIFDHNSAEWVPTVVTTSRVVLVPFSVAISSRELFIVKHRSFTETTVASVFREVLTIGENRRASSVTTDWDVQPILDEVDFDEWLRSIAVLDKISFVAKLPNPDAEPAYMDVVHGLRDSQAGEMQHTLKAANPDTGLSKNLRVNRITNALLEMSTRGYASISAWAHDKASNPRRFLQNNRAKRESINMASDNYNDARDELAEHSINSEGSDDG